MLASPWLATDRALGQELGSSVCHTHPPRLAPSFLFSITPSFPFSFPPPPLFFFLLPPATPQTCLRCSGRPCPFDDALRCWVIAQAAPSAWKDPMAPSPACLKPCPLPMPSKRPAVPRPLGAVLTYSSWSPSQARDSACAHRARQEPYGYFLT